jgi:hypothetical protein
MSKAAQRKITCGSLGCQGNKYDKGPDLLYAQNSHTYLTNYQISLFPLSTIEPRTKQDRKRYSVYNLAINRQVYVNLRPIRPHSSLDVPLRIHGNNQQSAGHEPVRPSSLVLFHLGQPRPYTSQSMFSVVVSGHHSVEPHTLSCAAYESRRGVSTGWCGVASKILRRSMRGVTQRTRPECG